MKTLVQLSIQFPGVHALLHELGHPAGVVVDAALGVVAAYPHVGEGDLVVDAEAVQVDPPGVDPEVLEPAVVEDSPASEDLVIVHPDPVVVEDGLGAGREVEADHGVQLAHHVLQRARSHVVVDLVRQVTTPGEVKKSLEVVVEAQSDSPCH